MPGSTVRLFSLFQQLIPSLWLLYQPSPNGLAEVSPQIATPPQAIFSSHPPSAASSPRSVPVVPVASPISRALASRIRVRVFLRICSLAEV